MGLDPVTLGIGAMAVGNIAGAVGGDRASSRAAKAANQRQNALDTMGQNMMVAPGASPYGADIAKLLQSINFTPADAPTVSGSQIDLKSLMPNLNPGNDALMQLLQADPKSQMDPIATKYLHDTVSSGGNPFDTSALFKSLGITDNENIDSQVSDLIASSTGGGLGERFGSGVATRQTNLRRKALEDINNRNAGIQQSSYEAGQGRAMGAAGTLEQMIQNLTSSKLGAATALNSGAISAAQLGLQGATANQNSTNRAGEVNASNILQMLGINNQQQNTVFNEHLQGILQQAGLLQNDRNFNAGIFQTLAGLPGQQTTPASNIPGSIGDIGTYMLLMNQINKPAAKAA